MSFLIAIVTILVFVAVDLLLRVILKRIERVRLRRERQAALDLGLRLEPSTEAISLKRVQVDHPKAKILAVDDEPIILDSFRKILVLAGYAVDTVESGREALGLVERNDYDFVFTDLKMPEYDGMEVTKAVKHLRPDIDVIMITGYATVESAVDAMKYGALDYVQKPFTEQELVGFVDKSLIRRQARIERELPPKIHVVTPTSPEIPSDRVFNVPAGLFISRAHVWLRIENNGELGTGIDDFARKTLGEIDDVSLPRANRHVRSGEPLFSLRHGSHSISFPSPVSGRVTAVNENLLDRPQELETSPYDQGWICRVDPDDLPEDLKSLRIGAGAVSWYEQEIDRLASVIQEASQPADTSREQVADATAPASDELWDLYSARFFHA